MEFVEPSPAKVFYPHSGSLFNTPNGGISALTVACSTSKALCFLKFLVLLHDPRSKELKTIQDAETECMHQITVCSVKNFVIDFSVFIQTEIVETVQCPVIEKSTETNADIM